MITGREIGPARGPAWWLRRFADVNAGWLRGNAEAEAYAASVAALGRVGQPEDIADVVAFLASDDARWVTGRVIDATGGAGL